MTRILTLSAALAAVTALAACEPTAVPTDPASNIPTGQYVLVGIGPETVPQRNVDMTINADGSLSGRGPCNQYNATQIETPPAFKVGAVTNTMMACSGLAGSLESRYFAALGQANGIKFDGGVLIISGPTYLTFEPGVRKE